MAKDKDDYNQNDEFFMNEEELFAETQQTIIDTELDKVLEAMEKKIAEARENLGYAEKGEFQQNVQMISRYVTAIIEIEQLEKLLEDGETSEDEVLDRIQKINLSVKELTFTDLTEYEKANKGETQVADDKDIEDPDEFDF